MRKPDSDSYILIIKDEPYETILMKEERLVNRTIDADLEIKERWYTINGKKIPEINILWHVKGITPETASSLDTKEQILLLREYLRGQKTLNSIKNHEDNSIVTAKKDYDVAVCSIFANQPDYEASCQSSLRFACKILKSKLQNEGKLFEEEQSLAELAGKLDDNDFKEIKKIIPWVRKSQGENGDDFEATLEDAVNAVRSSIALFSKLFPEKTKNRADT